MKKTNKKFIVLSIFVFLIVIFAGTKLYFSPLNTSRDVVRRLRDYRDPNHFILDSSKFPTIGISTEADIYRLLGNDIDSRLTFKTIRQKKIKDHTFNYNKIIVYEDTYYKFFSGKNGDISFSGGDPLEESQLVIYLLDGKVTFFSALNAARPNADVSYLPTNKSVNLDENGQPWPNSEKDIYDYYQENGLKYH